MQRKFLAAAVALAPLMSLAAGSAAAQVKITSVTSTPIATATANAGAPADITIVAGGAVTPTSPGAAVTINSNNSVTNQGTASFENVNDAVAILLEGGNTGSLVSTGNISVSETYAPTINTNDGLATGAFAHGQNRIGIEVTGSSAAPFNGGIVSAGPLSIQGNTSEGIDLQGPITGSLSMFLVNAPTTSGGTPTVTTGAITITGDNSTGLYVAPTGGVGGDVHIGVITALGVGVQGAVIDGAVGGAVNISGNVSATGYRSTTRQTIISISDLYTADQLQQGGPAVSIGANVAKGVIISAPPFPLPTSGVDQYGIPFSAEGTGAVTSFGQAPALQIGATTGPVVLGENGSGANAYGLIVQGDVTGNGVFDPLTTPNLPAVVPATAIQIGLANGGAVTIDGGVHNTGAITATSYQGDATGIHFGANASTPTILNDGSITTTSIQVNSAAGLAPVSVDAILIDANASVSTITNTNTIGSVLSGSGGVGGSVGGIIDKSGSVTSLLNSGIISATLNQTVTATPMPGSATAVDLSTGKAAERFTQSASAVATQATAFDSTKAYAIGALVSENNRVFEAAGAVNAGVDPASTPGDWRPVGFATPSIVGDMRFGSGGTTFTVTSGAVTSGVIDLGSGVDSLTVDGPLSQTITSGGVTTTTVGTSVTGSIQLGAGDAGQISLNVASGTLSDTNPDAVKAGAINVGANGILLVAADPGGNRNTDFIASGASSFAAGAQVGLTIQSVQVAPTEKYIIVQTTGAGTLTAGAFGSGGSAITPWLYTATPSFVPSSGPGAPSEIILTVAQKTSAELGFNKAESGALQAVLTALPGNTAIEANILSQTTQAGFQSAYDQLLPGQGQGIFQALDAAAEAISAMTAARPDAGTPVATDSSLWLQEVNERIDRRGIDSVGSNAKLLGLVAGYEKLGVAGGALGFTLAYLNDQEADSHAAVGAHVVASMVEGGAYYRYGAGPLTFTARGAGGYAFFSSKRRFVEPTIVDAAFSNWHGLFADAHVVLAYEQKLGRFYARPEISADYLYLGEGSHNESGGGTGFDLNFASRASSQASAQGVIVFGTQFGRSSWLRPEIRAGWREVFEGQVGDTTASFAGGQPFVLAADKETGGWATVGFSIKGGSAYSYIALEGDLDLRPGQERYDLRIAGRSAF